MYFIFLFILVILVIFYSKLNKKKGALFILFCILGAKSFQSVRRPK